MRYLGMSMGIGIAIGITLIVGTLMTPIINGNFDVLINTEGGRMTLLGVLVALIGVGIVTRAGQLKERKMGIKDVYKRQTNCRVTFLKTKNGKKRTVPISEELEKKVKEEASAKLFKVDYEKFCGILRRVKRCV